MFQMISTDDLVVGKITKMESLSILKIDKDFYDVLKDKVAETFGAKKTKKVIKKLKKSLQGEDDKQSVISTELFIKRFNEYFKDLSSESNNIRLDFEIVESKLVSKGEKSKKSLLEVKLFHVKNYNLTA